MRREETHDVAVESHKVEVLDALVRVLFHLALERLGTDDLADVLVDERVSAKHGPSAWCRWRGEKGDAR